MKISSLLLLLLLVSFHHVFAQRPSTDNFFHYYTVDGNYSTLLIAPGSLGPNALPVPEILNGNVGTDMLFKFSIDNYYRDNGGDNGHTAFINIRFPVVQNFMAFELNWDLLDYFHTTNRVRDIIQLYKDDPGWETEIGDIKLTTYIQILQERKCWPAVMLSSTLKTTTGSIYDGRHTDLPAHWHYLSIGENLIEGKSFKWRLNGMAGYYFWQTNERNLEQNEGPLWGLENQFNFKKLEIGAGFSGYKGWKFYGYDRPILFRTRFVLNGKKFNYFINYKTGLRDYPYSSIRAGICYHLLSPFELKK